eukprot:5980767-Lingulodinium_polyedra.AAC.1
MQDLRFEPQGLDPKPSKRRVSFSRLTPRTPLSGSSSQSRCRWQACRGRLESQRCGAGIRGAGIRGAGIRGAGVRGAGIRGR